MSGSLTEQAAMLAIDGACRELRLPTVRARHAELADAATRDRLTHRAFLAEVLGAEVEERDGRRRERRIADARFPRVKRLSELDLSLMPVPPATLASLSTLAWVTAGEPVVLLGDPGTGKTHVLIGLGMAACEEGLRVRYVTAAQLVNELAEAAGDHVLARTVARYARLDLLLLDELGYVHLDPRGAELLFQVITERDERASVAVASNLPFSEWGTVFPDGRLAAAVVDRLTYRAHVIETGSESYRLRAGRARKGGPTKG